MMRQRLALGLLVVLAVSLGACKTRVTNSDMHMGSAVANNAEQMVAKGNLLHEPRGIEGPTAGGIVENYHYNEESDVQEKTREGRGLLKVREN